MWEATKALLDLFSLNRQADGPTDEQNRAAYKQRVKDGEKLAEYMPDVDYTRPMGHQQ